MPEPRKTAGAAGGQAGGTPESDAPAAGAGGGSAAGQPADGRAPLLAIEEAEELMLFAARRGVDDGDGSVGVLHREILNHREAKEGAARREAEQKIFDAYAKLSAVTYETLGVNGRTLLDSRNPGGAIGWLWLVFVLALVLAFGTEILGLWFQDALVPEDDWLLRALFDFQLYALDYLSPFFWGAVGACVYLLKRLSDELAAFRFDLRRFRGWLARVALGGVLGLAVVVIFDFGRLEGPGLNIEANVAAFLSGLGVRVVYGAIERTVEAFAGTLNLAGVRRAERERAKDRGKTAQPTPDDNAEGR